MFDARRIDPWQSPQAVTPIPRPDYADDEELKKEYGINLGKGLNSFDAGLALFAGETAKGLWASVHWVNDPLVIAAKDIYLKSLKKLEKPLDKEELLFEVLARARKAEDDKDSALFFKLYSEIAGFTGKVADIAPTFNNNTTTVMQIKLVGGSEKSVLDAAPNSNVKSRIQNDENLLPRLKLVGGAK